jgi:hypothetical protein
MATTTNYGWTTPDDTALVKDGASAIRTLGSSVDTTTKALNPSTTLGDIEYRSSTANTNTRLAIGSTGNVLTVAGGVPTWAAPAGGGANFSLLNAGGTALSGTTTTVSGISGIGKLFISIEGASTGSDNSALRVRFNTDTGSNYIRNSTQIEVTGTYDSTYYSPAFSRSTTSIIVAQMDNSATSTMSAQMEVDGCNATGFKPYQYTGGGNIVSVTANTGPVWYFGGGVYAGTSAISSVSIVSDGTFDAGTVYIYGSA